MQDMWLLIKTQEALTSDRMQHGWRKMQVLHHTCYIQCCVCFCVGSSSSVRSQPDEFTQQLTVPTDLFRPISPHSHSDSESIPRLPPPRRAHALSRTLRRQVTNLHCFRFSLQWSSLFCVVWDESCVSCQRSSAMCHSGPIDLECFFLIQPKNYRGWFYWLKLSVVQTKSCSLTQLLDNLVKSNPIELWAIITVLVVYCYIWNINL